MQLISLKIKNLYSYEDAVLNFKKFRSGVILVEGINNDNPSSSVGAGKTSIWEVINWVLFDDTIKGENKDKVIRVGAKSGSAELVFSDDNHQIKVIKTRGKGRGIQIFVDGIEKEFKTVTEYLKFLNELMGVNFDIYRNSILLGQDDKNRLLYGTDKTRKDLVGGILNFSKIDRALEFVRGDILKDVDQDIAFTEKTIDMLNKEKQEHKTSLSSLQKNIEETEKRIELYRLKQIKVTRRLQKMSELKINISRRLELQKDHDELKKEFKKAKFLFDKTYLPERSHLGDLNLKYTGFASGYDPVKAERTVKNIEKELETERSIIGKLDLELAQLTASIGSDNSSIVEIQERCDTLEKGNSVVCPYCGQKVSEKCIWKLKNGIGQIRIGILRKNERIDVLNQRKKKHRDKEEKLVKSVAEHTERIKESEKKNSLKKEIESVEKLVSSMHSSWEKEKIQYQKRFSSIAEELNKLEEFHYDVSEYQDLLRREQKYKDFVSTESKRKDHLTIKKGVLERIIRNLKELHEKREKLEKKQQMSWTLEKLFGQDGFRVFLLDSIIPIIASKVEDYLMMLEIGHIKLTMNISDRNEFVIDVIVSDDSGEESVIPINLFSGGEKKLLTFLFNLALGEIVMDRKRGFDYLILDEITDGLDSLYNQQVMEMLIAMAERHRKRIFIITHRQETRDILESFKVQKIVVEKRNGKSTIRQD